MKQFSQKWECEAMVEEICAHGDHYTDLIAAGLHQVSRAGDQDVIDFAGTRERRSEYDTDSTHYDSGSSMCLYQGKAGRPARILI